MGWLPYVVILLATVAGGAINEAVAGHKPALFMSIALAAVAGCGVAFRRAIRRVPITLELMVGPLGVSMFRSMHGWALAIGVTLFAALIALVFTTRQALAKEVTPR
jgi:NADH:ubiquinone oxidoreductase subunit K